MAVVVTSLRMAASDLTLHPFEHLQHLQTPHAAACPLKTFNYFLGPCHLASQVQAGDFIAGNNIRQGFRAACKAQLMLNILGVT
jgi:hypothetical protein